MISLSSSLAIIYQTLVCWFRVHAVATPVPGCVPLRDLQNDMETLGLVGVAASDVLDVIEGYETEYGVSDDDLEGMFRG